MYISIYRNTETWKHRHMETKTTPTLTTWYSWSILKLMVIHTYIPTYIHTHIHTYIHTYIHTHINTYIHTYIHTHINT
jgi:hypothetical protein